MNLCNLIKIIEANNTFSEEQKIPEPASPTKDNQ